MTTRIALAALLTLAAPLPLAAPPARAAEAAPAVPAPSAAAGALHEAALVAHPLHHEAVGLLAPKQVATLASKIMGTVLTVDRREGDQARSGEVLVTIDDSEIRADLAALDAALDEIEAGTVEIDKHLIALGAGKEAAAAMSELADLTRERFARLREARTIAAQQLDKAEADRKMAASKLDEVDAQAAALLSKKAQLAAKRQGVLANIDKARTMLGYARVAAPFDGLVTARMTEVGAMAGPGAPLVTIENCCNMRFEAVVPEGIINRVKLGDKVEVTIDAAGIERVAGTVDEIVPLGDPMSHTFTVKIALPADPRMKSGMYARGFFAVGEASALRVPDGALERHGQLAFVRLPDGSRRFVRAGQSRDGMTEILSGLVPGEKIRAGK